MDFNAINKYSTNFQVDKLILTCRTLEQENININSTIATNVSNHSQQIKKCLNDGIWDENSNYKELINKIKTKIAVCIDMRNLTTAKYDAICAQLFDTIAHEIIADDMDVNKKLAALFKLFPMNNVITLKQYMAASSVFICGKKYKNKYVTPPYSDKQHYGHRHFGLYKCQCNNEWHSAWSWSSVDNEGEILYEQQCVKCELWVKPYALKFHKKGISDKDKKHLSMMCKMCDVLGQPCNKNIL